MQELENRAKVRRMSVFERISSDESGASSRASPANYNAHDEDDVAPLLPYIPIVRIGSSDARHTAMTPVVNTGVCTNDCRRAFMCVCVYQRH